MNPAYLIGPFVGEVAYEMYRFAPHALYLKSNNKYAKLIVYTREDRFDLYGKYADILIPLKLKNDSILSQYKYNVSMLSNEDYATITEYFHNKYKPQYSILEHVHLNLNMGRVELPWHLAPYQMSYDFQPRQANKDIVNKLLGTDKCLVVDLSGLYMEEYFHMLLELDTILPKGIPFVCYSDKKIKTEIVYSSRKIINANDIEFNINRSLVGCMIEFIKRSMCTISNNLSIVSHLSNIMGKDVLMSRQINELFLNSMLNGCDNNFKYVDLSNVRDFVEAKLCE